MSASPVFLGIDLGCAIGKALPVCFVAAGSKLLPLAIPKNLAKDIPKGLGNGEIKSALPFRETANRVAKQLKFISDEMDWKVRRIAVDAPAAPPSSGNRKSEHYLSARGWSSFKTPEASEWKSIRQKCVDHLENGGPASRLPHANKIWMLFGFELFSSLRASFNSDVIEVYPYAIVRSILPSCKHKTTEEGYRDQLQAIAERTGWEPRLLEAELKPKVSRSRHDRLDAFMSAWVASLEPEQRVVIGDATNRDDAIWVPK